MPEFCVSVNCVNHACPVPHSRPVCRPAPISIYPATDVKGPVNTKLHKNEIKSACRVACRCGVLVDIEGAMMAVDVHRAGGLKTSVGRRRPLSSSDSRTFADIYTMRSCSHISSFPTDNLKVESELSSCSSKHNSSRNRRMLGRFTRERIKQQKPTT